MLSTGRQARLEAGAERSEAEAVDRRLHALDTYGGPLLSIPRCSAGRGRQSLRRRGGDLRRFCTNQHQAYCGIDLQARSLDVCLLSQDGESLRHRHRKTRPETWRKAIAPDREELVVAVACLSTCSWRADLWAPEPIPGVLGHARSMEAIHGGKATHDTLDAQHSAVLRRGGMLPQAYVYFAERRATRDLRRRRFQLTRPRAALLTHVPQANWPSHRPALGQKLADTATRDRGAERGPDPAVPTSVAVALALMDSDDQRLSAGEWTSVQTATPHPAPTLDRLPSVPGIGTLVSWVLLSELHDITRCPRVQECASSGRLVHCAKAAAGQRYGPAGAKLGKTSLPWAFSEAAGLFRRNHPAAQKDLARLAPKPGKGHAWTVFAHKLARAVSSRLKRDLGFDRQKVRNGSCSGAGELTASRDDHGLSLAGDALIIARRQGTRRSTEALGPRSFGH